MAWLFWPSKKGTFEYSQMGASISMSPKHETDAGSKLMPQNNPHPSVNSRQAAEEQTEKRKESIANVPNAPGGAK